MSGPAVCCVWCCAHGDLWMVILIVSFYWRRRCFVVVRIMFQRNERSHKNTKAELTWPLLSISELKQKPVYFPREFNVLGDPASCRRTTLIIISLWISPQVEFSSRHTKEAYIPDEAPDYIILVDAGPPWVRERKETLTWLRINT